MTVRRLMPGRDGRRDVTVVDYEAEPPDWLRRGASKSPASEWERGPAEGCSDELSHESHTFVTQSSRKANAALTDRVLS
jgi:hypothetical protein